MAENQSDLDQLIRDISVYQDNKQEKPAEASEPATEDLFRNAPQAVTFFNRAERLGFDKGVLEKITRSLRAPTPQNIREVSEQLYGKGNHELATDMLAYWGDNTSNPQIVTEAIELLTDYTLSGDLLVRLIDKAVDMNEPSFIRYRPAAYFVAGNYDRASRSFYFIIKKASTQTKRNMLMYTSFVFIKLGYFEKSLEVLHLFVKLFEPSNGAIKNIANCWGVFSRKEALKYSRRLIEKEPDSVDNKLNHALDLFALGKFEQGFKYYRDRRIKK